MMGGQALALCPPLSSPVFDAGVTRLYLNHYRSYPQLNLECAPSPVILTGPNGAGKTNILEALSFLCPGQGLRQTKLSQISHHKEGVVSGLWSVAVHLSEGKLSPSVLGTGLEMREGKERRVIQMDGRVGLSQSDLTRTVGVIWLTPSMDRLFVEAAASRRRFLDRLVYVFDAGHASRVARYEYCVRERLRLLKARTQNKTWLDTLEEKAAQSAVAIACARLFLIERLNQMGDEALGFLPVPHLAIEGYVEDLLQTLPALKVEENFQALLAKNRTFDQECARTTQGVHRTDLVVFFQDKNMPAQQCSTGEQKALLLSLIMATARLRAKSREGIPLLLLDEVVAHLDTRRREALLAEILHLGMQTWMTGTDENAFSQVRGQMQHFQLEKGVLTPL
jgi:DNA replication and repair protein RecF